MSRAHEGAGIVVANGDWLRANPIAAKRALRAVLRPADSVGGDRGDAAKLATDKHSRNEGAGL